MNRLGPRSAVAVVVSVVMFVCSTQVSKKNRGFGGKSLILERIPTLSNTLHTLQKNTQFSIKISPFFARSG